VRNAGGVKIYLAGPLFSDAERGFLDTAAARLLALTAMAAPDCRNCASIGIHDDAQPY
jgi:nucleoside 2-deoxyribosyltransferase